MNGIFIILISIIVPIVIFAVCYKIKKTYLNIAISMIVLLASMFEKIYFFPLRNGFEIDVIDRFIRYFKYETVLNFWAMWFPGIIVCIIINFLYFIKTRTK